MGVRLFQISAFYQNDKRDGIGVTITEEAFDVPLTEIMDDIMESYWRMWLEAEKKEETEELVTDLLAQLNHVSENRQKLEMIDAAWVIGNIWLLERVGAIESDEYNGCVFGAEGGMYRAIPPQGRD